MEEIKLNFSTSLTGTYSQRRGECMVHQKKIPNHWILGASEKMSRSEVLVVTAKPKLVTKKSKMAIFENHF